MNKNLENYESTATRRRQCLEKHADCRIITEVISCSDKHAFVKASVYLTKQDFLDNAPKGTGYAQEYKGVGSPANRITFLENCETSAVGRALANAGFASNDNCTREEIERVLSTDLHEPQPAPASSAPPQTVISGVGGEFVYPWRSSPVDWKGKQLKEIPVPELEKLLRNANRFEPTARRVANAKKDIVENITLVLNKPTTGHMYTDEDSPFGKLTDSDVPF